MDLSLTKHFCDNWEKRVGGLPTAERVQRIIDESVFVQRCENLRRPDGSFFRMLAIYWHPELKMLFRVDSYEGNLVTVLTDECLKERGQRA